MSEQVYLASIGVLFGTPLFIFAMKYASAAYQARSRTLSDNAYRELATRAVTVQSENTVSLSAMQTSLAEIAARLASVEKILKEVG
jgi:regulator of extracellular matrix RemA (YlzA/DUF370 family)